MRGLYFYGPFGAQLFIILGIAYFIDVGPEISLGKIILYVTYFLAILAFVIPLRQKSKEKSKQTEIKIISIKDTDDKDALEYNITEKIREMEKNKIIEKEIINVQIINDKQVMICYKY